jgi:hypothetical protein
VTHRHRYFIPGCPECDRRLYSLMGPSVESSAIQLYQWDSIFYVREPETCFWCGDPCCRIDIDYEAALHYDCIPAVNQDLDRLNRESQARIRDRELAEMGWD